MPPVGMQPAFRRTAWWLPGWGTRPPVATMGVASELLGPELVARRLWNQAAVFNEWQALRSVLKGPRGRPGWIRSKPAAHASLQARFHSIVFFSIIE